MQPTNRVNLFSCAGVPSGSFTGRYFNMLANKRYFQERVLMPFDASRSYLSHIVHRIGIVLKRILATVGAILTTLLDGLWTWKMMVWRNRDSFEMGLMAHEHPSQHTILNIIRLWVLLSGYVPAVMPIYNRPVQNTIPTPPAIRPTPDTLQALTEYALATEKPARQLIVVHVVRLIYAGAIFDAQALKECAEWIVPVKSLLLGPGDRATKHMRLSELFSQLEAPLPPPKIVDESEAIADSNRISFTVDVRWNIRVELKNKIINIQNFLQPNGQFPHDINHLETMESLLTSLNLSSEFFTQASRLALCRRADILRSHLQGIPRAVVTLTALYWNGSIEPSKHGPIFSETALV